MARIRTIKPEFPQSESMGRVSRDARLLFIELWTICDDSGRTRAASRMLASLLFPYDDDAPKLIDGWLAELEREKCVVRYQVDGQTYLQVCNWLNHQKIDKPSASKIQAFDESSRILATPRECSSEEGIKERTKEGTKEEAPRKRVASPAAPPDVDPQVWTDWLQVRKAKRVATTATAIEQNRREAARAGIPFEEALRTCCARGWAGFNADWDWKPKGGGKQSALEARNRAAADRFAQGDVDAVASF